MPTPSTRPPQKRRKFNHSHEHSTKLTTSTTRGTSTSTLKKKVRDLERLLNNPKTNLPANIRLENERALEAFKHELNLAKGTAREVKMAKKYHMVRFFEKQKATRRLRQLIRLRDNSTPTDTLVADIHAAEVELNYIIHYPRGEKYISLFKDPGSDPKVVEKRDMIKKDIEKQMSRGTLGSGGVGEEEEEEGEGEEEEEVKEDEKKETKKKKDGKKDKKRRKDEAPLEEEEDGFFEF